MDWAVTVWSCYTCLHTFHKTTTVQQPQQQQVAPTSLAFGVCTCPNPVVLGELSQIAAPHP